MVQGRGIDADLNQVGERQAALFYKKYSKHSFDKIYVSQLKRTKQSVQEFINKGIPYEKLSGLDEISWGNQEGQPFSDEASRSYRETLDKWTSGKLDVSISNGETPLEVMERQKIAINTIMSKNREREVLICMHGRAMRILLTWLVGRDLSQMEGIAHTNLGLYRVDAKDGNFEVKVENDTSHLVEFTV